MALNKVDCPNCGANLDITNRNMLYCEFCGSKLKHSKPKKAKPVNSKLYDQVITELKFEKYDKLKQSLFKALLETPDNNDLLLIDAILKRDIKIFHQVVITSVGYIVASLCKREILKWQVDFHYPLDLDMIKKYNIFSLNEIDIPKYDISKYTEAKDYLCFARALMGDNEYKDTLDELNELNNKSYCDLEKRVSIWKSLYITKFWWSIAWFLVSIGFIALALSFNEARDAFTFFAVLFGIIGIITFTIRKRNKNIA